MSEANHHHWDQRIFDLVSEYEASAAKGATVFLDERSFLQIIEYYELEDMWHEALTVAKQALEHYRYSTDFYLRYAQLLLQSGRKEESLRVLNRALSLMPSDFDLLLFRAEILVHLQLFDEALAELAPFKLSANGEDLSEILLVESLVYEKREAYEHMFYALKAALEANPNNQEALERLWLCTDLCRKHQESIPLYHWIIDQHPYSSRAWHNLGHAQAYLGNNEEALEAYEYAFIIDENAEDAYYDFADLCFETRHYEQALDTYMEISERFAADVDLIIRLGECYHQLGHHETARRYLEQAARLDTHNDEIFYWIGECYAAQEKWSKACEFFAKAIRMQVDQENYHSALAEAAFELGNYQLAEIAYRQALDLNPDNSQLWLSLAWFLQEMLRPEEALEVLEEGNATLIEQELTYSFIASLFGAGRRQEAIQRLSEALIDDHSGYQWLYEWMPELRHDSQVIALISLYRPE